MPTVWGTGLSATEPRTSLRFRTAAWLAALALIVILLQSVALIAFIDHKEEVFIEHQLGAQILHSMDAWRKSPDAAFPNVPDMWLYRVSKTPGQSSRDTPPPPLFATLAVGNHEVFLGSREYHVAVRDDEVARYFLVLDVEEHESRLGGLLAIVIASAILLGALTLWAGFRIAGRLTRHLDGLAARVASDSPGPLVEVGMDREVLAVAQALDKARERQQAMLERERAFVANLSHELRTPLTGIRTDAELLTTLPDVPNSVIRRGSRIVDSVDRISELASSLLWLARETSVAAPETVHLKAAIAGVWDALEVSGPRKLNLRLDMSETATVHADPSLFDLVVRNLLENARRHSSAGEILCRLDGTLLSVRDCGPGFAEDQLERIFDRFFVGERGASGLGLALVRHVCTASGWTVSARNTPLGGEVLIDFGRRSD